MVAEVPVLAEALREGLLPLGLSDRPQTLNWNLKCEFASVVRLALQHQYGDTSGVDQLGVTEHNDDYSQTGGYYVAGILFYDRDQRLLAPGFTAPFLSQIGPQVEGDGVARSPSRR